MVDYSELCSAAGIHSFAAMVRYELRNVTVGVFGISHDSIYDDGQLTPFERRGLLGTKKVINSFVERCGLTSIRRISALSELRCQLTIMR